MQTYEKISITKEEIVPLAKKMREEGRTLSMIHAFREEDGRANVSYEYEVKGGVESYTVEGEDVLPSISAIYDKAAEWPEREIMELLDITFEGVDTSVRLFLPESMLNEQGQILVTPMDELLKRKKQKSEAAAGEGKEEKQEIKSAAGEAREEKQEIKSAAGEVREEKQEIKSAAGEAREEKQEIKSAAGEGKEEKQEIKSAAGEEKTEKPENEAAEEVKKERKEAEA